MPAITHGRNLGQMNPSRYPLLVRRSLRYTVYRLTRVEGLDGGLDQRDSCAPAGCGQARAQGSPRPGAGNTAKHIGRSWVQFEHTGRGGRGLKRRRITRHTLPAPARVSLITGSPKQHQHHHHQPCTYVVNKLQRTKTLPHSTHIGLDIKHL